MLKEFDTQPNLNGPTSALPGGTRTGESPADSRRATSLISDLIGMELPPKPVLDYLLETYFKSVHWFMLLFYEPTFRQRYEEVTQSGRVPRREFRRLALLLLVLAMGARYAQSEHVNRQWPDIDLQVLQHAFFTKIKENLFEILDEGELESVQICTLLSSFYLYNSSPNLAFIILGTGVRCAQAMSLHRESTWPVSSQIAREERKRVWWALYVFDRYVNQSFVSVASV